MRRWIGVRAWPLSLGPNALDHKVTRPCIEDLVSDSSAARHPLRAGHQETTVTRHDAHHVCGLQLGFHSNPRPNFSAGEEFYGLDSGHSLASHAIGMRMRCHVVQRTASYERGDSGLGSGDCGYSRR